MKLNFNYDAMAAPATTQEFIALLDEGLRLVDELTEMTFASTKLMEEAICLSEA